MPEEGPNVNIDADAFKSTLKKISNWKTPRLDGMHRF